MTERKAANSGVTVKLVETPAELEGAIAVRMRVFVGEQGIAADVEVDDADTAPETIHAVAVHGGAVIATGRLLPRRCGERAAYWPDGGGTDVAAVWHRRPGAGIP